MNSVWPDIILRDCSGLLGRTSLRQAPHEGVGRVPAGLFRPSRPDFIETEAKELFTWLNNYLLFRPSRPDFIETSRGGSGPPVGGVIVPAF